MCQPLPGGFHESQLLSHQPDSGMGCVLGSGRGEEALGRRHERVEQTSQGRQAVNQNLQFRSELESTKFKR